MNRFLLLLFLLAATASCRNELEAIERVLGPEAAAVETIRDFELLYSDSAIVRVRVTGPLLLRHLSEEEPRQEFPEGLLVEFLDPYQQPASYLTARYAVRLEDKNTVVARDSVVWESVQGERLETEELTWDEKSQKIFTNKFVTVRRNREIIWGYGFEADQDFSRSRIKAIEGRIQMEDLPLD